jgi:hypothetical protein
MKSLDVILSNFTVITNFINKSHDKFDNTCPYIWYLCLIKSTLSINTVTSCQTVNNIIIIIEIYTETFKLIVMMMCT